VLCWGDNKFSQTATDSPDMVLMPALAIPVDMQDIAAGANHSCATHINGQGLCWGMNNLAQVGTTPQIAVATPNPVKLGAFEQVDGGDAFTCARLTGGGVACWGGNEKGQLALIVDSIPHPSPQLANWE
jgi:alpha-tubulin suppressor-like RCC1 family protein